MSSNNITYKGKQFSILVLTDNENGHDSVVLGTLDVDYGIILKEHIVAKTCPNL